MSEEHLILIAGGQGQRTSSVIIPYLTYTADHKLTTAFDPKGTHDDELGPFWCPSEHG